MLAALHEIGCDFAHFHSSSRLAPHDAARSLTGSGSRHLDCWAMSRSTCLRTLLRAAADSEVAVIEGDFGPPGIACPSDLISPANPSNLSTLSDWLNAPRIAIVQLDSLDPCRLPRRPERLDALLLDQAIDARHAAHWQTNLEAHWGVPVLGWLDRAESLRSLCRTLAGRPRSVAGALCRPGPPLAGQFATRQAARPDRSLPAPHATRRRPPV